MAYFFNYFSYVQRKSKTSTTMNFPIHELGFYTFPEFFKHLVYPPVARFQGPGLVRPLITSGTGAKPCSQMPDRVMEE